MQHLKNAVRYAYDLDGNLQKVITDDDYDAREHWKRAGANLGIEVRSTSWHYDSANHQDVRAAFYGTWTFDRRAVAQVQRNHPNDQTLADIAQKLLAAQREQFLLPETLERVLAGYTEETCAYLTAYIGDQYLSEMSDIKNMHVRVVAGDRCFEPPQHIRQQVRQAMLAFAGWMVADVRARGLVK